MRLITMFAAIPLLCHAALAQAQTPRATAPASDGFFVSAERDLYTGAQPMRGAPGAQCTTHRWQSSDPEHTMVATEVYDGEGRLVASSDRHDGPAPARVDVMLNSAVSYKWEDGKIVGIDVISRQHESDRIIAKKISRFIRDKKGHVIKVTTDYTDYSGAEPVTTKYVSEYTRDKKGRVVKTSDNERGKKRVSVYRYSEDGLTLEERDVNDGTFKLVMTFDAAGRIAEATYPARYINYDEQGRIALMKLRDGKMIRRWSYDEQGRITSLEWRQAEASHEEAPAKVEVVYRPGSVEASCTIDGTERVRFKVAGAGCVLSAAEAQDLGMRCWMSKVPR